MKHSLWLVLFTALLLQFSCKKDDPQVDPPIDTANTRIKGADLSFLPRCGSGSGISYYPRWHGKDLMDLQEILTSLKTQFQKEVIIAETAYPFTLNWDDQTTNLIGLEEHLILPDFPATSEGQHDFLIRLWEIINASNADGLCYWAPDWVAHKGPQATDGLAWENQALFGFDGRVQPGAAFP